MKFEKSVLIWVVNEASAEFEFSAVVKLAGLVAALVVAMLFVLNDLVFCVLALFAADCGGGSRQTRDSKDRSGSRKRSEVIVFLKHERGLLHSFRVFIYGQIFAGKNQASPR